MSPEPIMRKLKLASLGARGKRTLVPFGPKHIGRDFVLTADPCSVESEAQVLKIARKFKTAGAHGLMIEVHPRPEKALRDNDQQYPLDRFPQRVRKIRRTAALIGSFSAARAASESL